MNRLFVVLLLALILLPPALFAGGLQSSSGSIDGVARHDISNLTTLHNSDVSSITTRLNTDVSSITSRLNTDVSSLTSALPGYVSRGAFRQDFSATAGQTVFDLSFSYTVGAKELLVFVGGILIPQSDFTETSSTRITLGTGLPVGTLVRVFRL